MELNETLNVDNSLLEKVTFVLGSIGCSEGLPVAIKNISQLDLRVSYQIEKRQPSGQSGPSMEIRVIDHLQPNETVDIGCEGLIHEFGILMLVRFSIYKVTLFTTST